jgi:hypothetical protein
VTCVDATVQVCRGRLRTADTDYIVPISRVYVGHNCDQAMGTMRGVLGSISTRESDPGILHTARTGMSDGSYCAGHKMVEA